MGEGEAVGGWRQLVEGGDAAMGWGGAAAIVVAAVGWRFGGGGECGGGSLLQPLQPLHQRPAGRCMGSGGAGTPDIEGPPVVALHLHLD